MKKLSELSKDTTLIVSYNGDTDGQVMELEDFLKLDYLKERKSYEGLKVQIADEHYTTFKFSAVFESLAEENEMYEDWQDDIERDFRGGSNLDLRDIEEQINNILHGRPSYSAGEDVDIDS